MTRSTSWRSVHSVAYLVTVVLLVFLSLVGTDLPEKQQIAVLVLFVAVLGVPHGALDPLVAYEAGIARNRVEMVRFLCVYLLQAAAMLFAWWLFPVLAFVLFLLISVQHFSGDWKEDFPAWQRLAGATTVIGGPPLFHPTETARIFAVLIPESTVLWLMPSLKLLGAVAIFALVLNALAITLTAASPRRYSWRSALELLSLPLLAWALPPLAFFVVYFCGLHSPRHFLETTEQLRVRPSVVLAVTIGITLVTLGFCLAAFLLLRPDSVDARLVQIVFIGLAALTVPHMLLMERAKPRAAQLA